MRYGEITSPRFQLPPSHRHLAEVVIDPMNWHLAQWVAADDPGLRIIGHQRLGERLIVFVACTSDEVRCRVMDDWS